MPVDLRWALTTLLCLLFAIPIVVTKADPDLWGHTRYGMEMLRTGSLPLEDPFSFTQDRPWINHEWLSELLMAAAYTTGGVAGLVTLKSLVIAIAFLLIASALRPLHPLARAGLLALAIAASPSVIGTVRPQIWTLLGLVILVRLLQTSRYRWSPVLFAAWINFHGGWIVGMGVLATWSAASVIEQWWNERDVRWSLLLLPLASFAATLLNPYGWTMWSFLASTVSFTRDIQEWRPIYSGVPTGTVAMVLTAALACGVHTRRELRPGWPWTAVLLVLAFGSVRVTRVAALAAPLAVLIAGPALATWWASTSWSLRAPSRAAAALSGVPLALIALFVLRLVTPSLTCIPLEGAWIPETRSGQLLAFHAQPGRIVTLFGWGQYAIWHFGPRLRVSWDGRRETVYSDDVGRIHAAVYEGTPEGDEWLSRVRPEYVWLSHAQAARREWLQTNGYRIDVQTEGAYVAVREDLPEIESSLPAPTLCFP